MDTSAGLELDMPMLVLRKAIDADLDFLVETDLAVDREDAPDEPDEPATWNDTERATHRAKIASFITDEDKGAWVYEDTQDGARAGMILFRFRDREHEPRNEANDFLFRCIDAHHLPPDGRFCEIFQLWVAPPYRRRGLATRLKQQAEVESRQCGLRLIYTHTCASNPHVIQLNLKLGYREIRRGPLWDDVVRVSLVKWL
jgi:ribosomal protein S18 acetylase RimI-like enzyme